MAAKHEEPQSRMALDVVSGSSTLTIPNFSQAPSPGVGKFLSSEVFAAGGSDWAIRFFPGGRNPMNSDYTSVYVALMSDVSRVDWRALFVLLLEDQSGNNNHLVEIFEQSLESLDYPATYGNMWGNPTFAKRDRLAASCYLKNDTLILHCVVGVVNTRLEGPISYRVVVPPSDMGQDLKALLDSGLGTDVNFLVGSEIFKAHKVILAARSSKFEAQFFGGLGDSNKKYVWVKDVDPPIFKAILEFIYTDEFPDISISQIESSTSTNVLMHLMAAADYYCVNRLRLLCESRLSENITTATVAAMVVFADQHQFHKLKAICLKFAMANLEAVMESEGFKSLRDICPSVMSEFLALGAAWSA
ncbi:BTB/POZ and MATH domain-containing protein 3-like [Rhodamnia argentea]|uniref:BTB/POZ and MATH domain-containing protein 3-like n=1 Tax=Rhodamnia argentea TaxID=178133 RepID=A0A8B8NVU3_9MYRT|nr:BTB/POZ and MATH domain-containing protein 3-like [Rhodamnia argentea]